METRIARISLITNVTKADIFHMYEQCLGFEEYCKHNQVCSSY